MKHDFLQTALAWAMICTVIGGILLWVNSRSDEQSYYAHRCQAMGLTTTCTNK